MVRRRHRAGPLALGRAQSWSSLRAPRQLQTRRFTQSTAITLISAAGGRRALLTLLAAAGALSWSELVTGLAQDDGGYRLLACGALHRLHMVTASSDSLLAQRSQAGSMEDPQMPCATDCQVIIGVCHTPAKLP